MDLKGPTFKGNGGRKGRERGEEKWRSPTIFGLKFVL